MHRRTRRAAEKGQPPPGVRVERDKGLAPICFSTDKSVSAARLAEIYWQYIYVDDSGAIIPDEPRAISDGVLHEGKTESWFKSEISREDCHLEVARAGRQTVGYCLYYTGSPARMDKYVKRYGEASNLSCIGYISLVCVDRAWTRRRVGQALVVRAMAAFVQVRVQLALAEIAVEPVPNKPSLLLFERLGWRNLDTRLAYDIRGKKVWYTQFVWSPTDSQ